MSFGKIKFLPPCIWDLPFMSYRLRTMSLVVVYQHGLAIFIVAEGGRREGAFYRLKLLLAVLAAAAGGGGRESTLWSNPDIQTFWLIRGHFLQTKLILLLIFQLRYTMFNINLNCWGPLLIFHCWRSVEGSLKGCRDGNRTRACRKASRRSTVWAAPHPKPN